MPTYEYRCNACGNEFEKFQRITEEPGAACPACGEAAERRLSGGAGLLFKGSGFYITDYRSDSYKQAAKSEGGASGAAAAEGKTSSGAKASDSKPAKSE